MLYSLAGTDYVTDHWPRERGPLKRHGLPSDSASTSGTFVVVEGGDGAGKTSVRKHLYRNLRNRDIDVLSLQGRCFLNPEYTEVITRSRFHDVNYSSSRILAAHIGDRELLSERILQPHLRWRHVVCDRYLASDIAYQSVLWQMEPEVIWRGYATSTVVRPDLIVYLDTPPEVAVERLARRASGSLFPWERLAVQREVYALFSEILFGDRFPPMAPTLRVDNTGPLSHTQDIVVQAVLDLVDPTSTAPSRASGLEAR